mmetsp:Transcript_82822/g.257294  ORF Transcript_82822/g.257294 Transcript_82822/m.257294 type:complete len:227 (-) Transcript_82822:26-706(-)
MRRPSVGLRGRPRGRRGLLLEATAFKQSCRSIVEEATRETMGSARSRLLQRAHEVLREHAADLRQSVCLDGVVELRQQYLESRSGTRGQLVVADEPHLRRGDVLGAELGDDDLALDLDDGLPIVDPLLRLPIELDSELEHGPGLATLLDRKSAVPRGADVEEAQGCALRSFQRDGRPFEELLEELLGPRVAVDLVPRHGSAGAGPAPAPAPLCTVPPPSHPRPPAP